MPDAYMPTTEDILRYFSAPAYKVDPQGEGEDFASYLSRVSIETMHSRIASQDAARRWLDWHDRQVREALLDALTLAEIEGLTDESEASLLERITELRALSIHTRQEES